MTTPAVAECLVCGKETKNRCSSCAKAGIDLFFCSPEHQKLVWHVHRLFCGPGKANPWRWPLLSPDEVQAAIATLDLVSVTHSESKTLADQLLRIYNEPRERLPDIIRSLSGPTGLPLDYETSALACVRMHAHFVRGNNLKNDGILKPSPPLEILTSLRLSSFLYCFRDDPPPWVTGYLHRLSIFVALLTGKTYSDEQVKYLVNSIDGVYRYLDTVAETDPEGARMVEGGFRRFLEKFSSRPTAPSGRM
ncbi:hypothetical protein NBRC10512_005819 [Rhodotorula toruloides]|uniref:RHTO0S21e02278g1_1 n=2 Tax=Rhodotorula toruloides TaxID=5286 RepID=A0A061BG29_RHOTO|nr:zinc finger, MYND-type protein [Rhodotorula toruloides NP11]EMS18768.1 zinc finger, MYND-type protein [Rhodotorula toruloides NP11]KAJ8294813.1 hypothetical protein OF846_001889 [Rhodotorula toruloides]CDR48948.1 RHTO0S21e02278g1_1 [Rhodotorula toruloides]